MIQQDAVADAQPSNSPTDGNYLSRWLVPSDNAVICGPAHAYVGLVPTINIPYVAPTNPRRLYLD